MLGNFNLVAYDNALNQGLSIEIAVSCGFGWSHRFDLSHSPRTIVHAAKRIVEDLSDGNWSSPQTKAESLHDLGLAQLGSLDVVDNDSFNEKMAVAITNVIIPTFLRDVFPNNKKMLKLARKCEKAHDLKTAYFASLPFYDISETVVDNLDEKNKDNYLKLAANLAVNVLKELNSPGCQFLTR